MRINISPEMKSRLQNAATNGSVVAQDILSELGRNCAASEIIRGNYNYFTTKRIKSSFSSYHRLRIVFTACGKNLGHENFPDKGNPSAPWFQENRADLEPTTFVGLFRNLREYTSEELHYFKSAITVDSKVSVKIYSDMKDFFDAYSECNYTLITDSGESTLHNSCMRSEDKARNAADFYSNFAGVKILVAKDKDSNILGRAIIWEGLIWRRDIDNDVIDIEVSLLDRLYASHSFIIEMMKDAARKEGIVFRKQYNDFSHAREVVALNPVVELDAGDETLADLCLEVPVCKWHKKGVPYLDIMHLVALNNGMLELRNHYTSHIIADCQSTSGYASRHKYVCPRCNAIHDSSMERFCSRCLPDVYTETIFGRVLNGHAVDYKGGRYPSFLFKRGKPLPELSRYMQIEKLFNNE